MPLRKYHLFAGRPLRPWPDGHRITEDDAGGPVTVDGDVAIVAALVNPKGNEIG